MRPESKLLLWDVADCARFIVESSESKRLVDYVSDRLFRQAVERNLEVIGEALNALRRDDPELAIRIDGLTNIVALRNRLAHGYRDINDEMMWTYVVGFVPELLQQVEILLLTVNADWDSENE